MSRTISLILIVWAFAFLLAPFTAAQDNKKADATSPSTTASNSQDVADAMAVVMPGKVHEKLAKLVGQWNVEMTIEVAGMDPQTSQGNAELEMILGGRFIQESGDGKMMGFPVEHVRLWGYNNGSKKYQAVWVYTMSTGFLQMEGTSQDDGKSIQWTGHFDNEEAVREEVNIVTTFIDDDHFEIEMIAGKMPDGSMGPKMKSFYSRIH